MMEETEVVKNIKNGLELFRSRNFIDAKTVFRQVVETWPHSFFGWFHLGRTLFYLKEIEEAKTAFQHALRENLELANAWINAGKFCELSTGHETEESCLTEYLYEHEREGDIRKLLAEVFYDNRSIVTREHCFDEKAVSGSGAQDARDTSQTLIERRNCHVTTH